MTKQTHKPNEAERREKIAAAIEESVTPRPANLTHLAKKTGEHRTMVWRQINKKWIYTDSGWMPRDEDEAE